MMQKIETLKIEIDAYRHAASFEIKSIKNYLEILETAILDPQITDALGSMNLSSMISKVDSLSKEIGIREQIIRFLEGKER